MAREKEDVFSWEFRSIDYEAKAFQPLVIQGADKTNAQYARYTTLVANLTSTVGSFAKDVGAAIGSEQAKKTASIISAVTTLISGGAKLASDILGIQQSAEDKKGDDPILKLYETLVPEIARIVDEKLDAAFIDLNIGNAMGVAKTGRDCLATASILLNTKLVTSSGTLSITNLPSDITPKALF